MKKTRIKTAHKTGLDAEFIAALILRLKGYKILARRFKTRSGEIDIIARRGAVLVFAEVKSRPTLAAALSCLTPHNQTRIINAARHYLAQNPAHANATMRFDFIAIAPPLFWRHLDNAWIVPT